MYNEANADDTRSRNLYKNLVQVDLRKKLACLTWFLVLASSCTSSCTQSNTRCSMQEAYVHMTKTERCDWSAAFVVKFSCTGTGMNFYQNLMQETCASFLYKLSFLSVCHQHNCLETGYYYQWYY